MPPVRFTRIYGRRGSDPQDRDFLVSEDIEHLLDTAPETWIRFYADDEASGPRMAEMCESYALHTGEVFGIAVGLSTGAFAFEHWHGDRRLRAIAFDDDGWRHNDGSPEPWEAALLAGGPVADTDRLADDVLRAFGLTR